MTSYLVAATAARSTRPTKPELVVLGARLTVWGTRALLQTRARSGELSVGGEHSTGVLGEFPSGVRLRRRKAMPLIEVAIMAVARAKACCSDTKISPARPRHGRHSRQW